MRVHEIVYDPKTEQRHVFSRTVPINLITGIGRSMLNSTEGRIFIVGGAKIITTEPFERLAQLYLDNFGG